MIRVLIAEDSPSTQRVLTTLLSDQEGIEIIGFANNGQEAVEKCRDLKPDLITMDIFMPKMDGLEATKQIMREYPTRIVLVSSIVDSRNLKNSFEAIRSGAVELIEKPHGVLRGNYSKVRRELVRVVRQLMDAHPDKLQEYSDGESTRSSAPPTKEEKRSIVRPKRKAKQITVTISEPEIICIGGSTGAPAVLRTLLSRLPRDYPIPIAIAQHISSGFIRGMTEWLDSESQIEVRVARSGDLFRPGLALVAPDHTHMQVQSAGTVHLATPRKKETYVPSIDLFFESIAEAYGSGGLGIILSGMGNDGCSGLKKMREKGAMTVAQSESSSVVYGMPMVAFEQGAAVLQMDPHEIVGLLEQIAR